MSFSQIISDKILLEVFIDHDVHMDGDDPREFSEYGKGEANFGNPEHSGSVGEYKVNRYKHKTLVFHKGSAVARIEHYNPTKDQKTLKVTHAIVHESHRGKGLMGSVYKHLANAGHKIISDTTLSGGADRMWKKLSKSSDVSVSGWDNNRDKEIPLDKVHVGTKDTMKAHFTSYMLKSKSDK